MINLVLSKKMQITDQILKTYFIESTFKKNEYLTLEGDIEQYVFYIRSGVVRFATNVFDDKEFTVDFGLPGDFVNSYDSYKNNCQSQFSIQAISVVHAFRIDKQAINDALIQNPEFSFLIIEVLERLLIKKTERELSFIKYSPQEKYQHLMDKEPYLIKNIPLKFLASYIGITPQALSRIRKRIY